MKQKLLYLALAAVCATNVTSRAEEGAAGHYMPGTTATFIDALPGKPGFVLADAFTYYDADTSLSRPILLGGRVALGAKATAYAETIFGIYETPLRLLG